jgi:hypothetical protein
LITWFPQGVGVSDGVCVGVGVVVGVRLAVDVTVAVGVGDAVTVFEGVAVGVADTTGVGWIGGGALGAWPSAVTIRLAVPQMGPLSMSIPNPPAPYVKPDMARLWLYMKTTTCPFPTVKPSLGGGAQTLGSVVGTPLQNGGSPLDGRPKAKVVTAAEPAQGVAVTPVAIHALGTLPALLDRGKMPASLAPPAQPAASRQISIAPAPVPMVRRPALSGLNDIVRLLGESTPLRVTEW